MIYLSVIVVIILKNLCEGVGINAVTRTFNVSKNYIYSWLSKFSKLKEVMFLYCLCMKYTSMIIEGDELYTKDKQLFKNAIRILYDIIKQTDDLKLFTNGERRYSKMLFEK